MSTYDLEDLRSAAAQSQGQSSATVDRLWSRYHHALQAMYERGELVSVGKGVAPDSAPEVIFTDGERVVMLGKVPDQFVRYVREDRRFPSALPSIADSLRAEARNIRNLLVVNDYERGYEAALMNVASRIEPKFEK